MSKKVLQPVKYYHASPYRHAKGAVLLGVNKPDEGYYFSQYPYLFLTTSPIPHFTIIDTAIEEGWFVYEVKPLDRVLQGDWNDAICSQVEVIRVVGNARGIARHGTEGSRVYQQGKLYYRSHYASKLESKSYWRWNPLKI